MAQLHKMKKHRKWFLNPPKEKPTRKGFGLTDSPKVSGAGLQALASISLDLFKDNFADEIRQELSYRDEKKKWDNYVSWRDNRNPIRRKMEEKFGYDGKAASHLFRLIKEGKELLLTGNIIFPLRDAEEILDVKNGKYTYEEMIKIAEGMDSKFDLWYNKSSLPDKPDRKKLTSLYFEIIDDYYYGYYEEEV